MTPVYRPTPSRRSTGHGWLRAAAPNALAVLLLGISIWQMDLLTRPSQTYGSGGSQLLNSDIWVTIQDLTQHRYELPLLPHARDNQGVLVIEPRFDTEYLTKHLDLVRQFFEPYSAIQTNRGSQHEISSMLLVFFGAVFALMRPSKFRGEASTE
jgi:hypothetical protein